jgi:hypothetical protein
VNVQHQPNNLKKYSKEKIKLQTKLKRKEEEEDFLSKLHIEYIYATMFVIHMTKMLVAFIVFIIYICLIPIHLSQLCLF